MKDRFSFRAWNKKEKKYIDDIQECDNGYGVGEPCRMCFGDYLYECETYEVEQCTGMKDKNGHLIYEGDILKVVSVKYHTYSYQCVDYCNTVCAYWFHRAGYMGVLSEDCTFEIVGNIHENYELLRGGE